MTTSEPTITRAARRIEAEWRTGPDTFTILSVSHSTTARFFVDERSGEAREAASARQPKPWPMHTGAQEFARWIVTLAYDPTGGV